MPLSENIRIFAYVITVLIVLLLPVLLIVSGLSLYLCLSKDEIFQSSESFLARYYQVNFETGESNSGIVSLFEKLEDEDFISYQNDFGEYFLITNFETTQYTCYAVCYCETSTSRRSSTTTFSRSLYYLVAAVSSILAYNIAEEYFREECKREIGDTCVKESEITSEVHVCTEHTDQKQQRQGLFTEHETIEDKIGKLVGEGDKISEEEFEARLKELEDELTIGNDKSILDEEYMNMEYEKKVYDCVGKCLPFDKEFPEEFSEELDHIEKSKEFGCAKIELHKHFAISFEKGEDFQDSVTFQLDTGEVTDFPEGLSQREYAEMVFMQEDLHRLCAKSSLIDYGARDSAFPEKKNACIGFYLYHFEDPMEGLPRNEFVKCTFVSVEDVGYEVFRDEKM